MVYAAKSLYRPTVCVAIGALALTLLTPQTGRADDRALELLRQWVTAVQKHTPGEVDDAAKSIAAWPRDDVTRAERYLITLVEFSVGKDRPSMPLARMTRDLPEIHELAKTTRSPVSPWDFPKRAALLHSDIVMLVGWKETQVPSPMVANARSLGNDTRTPSVRVLSPDGRLSGYELSNPHWDIARDVLRPVPADEDVRRWFHMVAAYFAKNFVFADLSSHLEQAMVKMPDDPRILYDNGCHQEALASPMVQDFVRQTILPPGAKFAGMSSPEAHWQRAESLFRRALLPSEEFSEAQLRLGRVLGLQGKHADAIRALDRADAGSSSPSIKYFANLFRGDSERALGHRDRAKANYETAVALYPRSQAGRLALSHLLREGNERLLALDVLEPALKEGALRTGDDDPWLDYYQCEGPYLEQIYESVVEPFRQERAQ